MGSDYMPVPFDSRKIYYRSPFGAVEQGTEIHFRILLPKAEHTQKAHLCVKYDYDCNWEFTELIWCGKFDEDTEIWECDFTPKKIGLYWYNFKLTAIDKIRYVIPSDPYKVSTIEDYMGRSWQITCYKKGFKTPGWLVGGIMYQIFPDRFYFSGEEKNIKRTDFKRNKDWYALPEWKPDENGMIKNNDFFMGDLKGITMKLDYLESLGVSCIYLNPISEAYSNHRYDTGDYSKVDPILGTEEDFKHLCAEAKKRGIHIINDGVFSHTGSDSVYFNRYGKYGKGGAYNDKNSPYFSWYKFNEWPNNYQSWWGFDTLPEVIEETPSFNEYINGKDREWQADTKLDDEHKKLGVKLLKVASAMQFTLPGFPCIYYGDEAGMEGYRDPFNRCCYPWGKENKELIEWHKKLADVRKSCSALWDGDFINVLSEERRISYIRHDKDSAIFCTFNLYDYEVEAKMPPGYADGKPVFGSKLENGILTIPPMSAEFVVLELGT